MNVLIVAHDLQFKMLAKQLLAQDGHEVLLVKTGREGLLLFKSKRIDLVIAEFEMPFMDGLTLLQLVHSSSMSEATPFIIVYKNEEERKRLPLEGADHCSFVAKSTFSNQLADLLHQLASTGATVSPPPPEPKEAPAPYLPPPVVEPLPRHTSARILLVDDEDSFRLLLRDTLEDEGYLNISMAADGGEAIDLLKKNEFDLVVLDIVMPVVSGFGVLHFLHDHSPTTKVVMLTAYADMRLAVEAKGLGASDFIAKPIMRKDFFRTIEHVLSS
jgi:DNA-binding NtrC family response regulator